MENPWNIQSIYDLQYFNCPSCVFKNNSKQVFVNHAFYCHPNSVHYLINIKDESLKDIDCPWDRTEIKEEDETAYPLKTEIKIENDNEDNFYDDYKNTENISTELDPHGDDPDGVGQFYYGGSDDLYYPGMNISHENRNFSGIYSKISKLFRIKKIYLKTDSVVCHRFNKFLILSQKQFL